MPEYVLLIFFTFSVPAEESRAVMIWPHALPRSSYPEYSISCSSTNAAIFAAAVAVARSRTMSYVVIVLFDVKPLIFSFMPTYTYSFFMPLKLRSEKPCARGSDPLYAAISCPVALPQSSYSLYVML